MNKVRGLSHFCRYKSYNCCLYSAHVDDGCIKHCLEAFDVLSSIRVDLKPANELAEETQHKQRYQAQVKYSNNPGEQTLKYVTHLLIRQGP